MNLLSSPRDVAFNNRSFSCSGRGRSVSAGSLRIFRLALLWLCLGMLTAACGSSDLPSDTSESSDGEEVRDLRVMAYNIQHGRGMDGELDLERIADVILEEEADIVALQEVDVGVERSNRLDIATELAELTGLEHMAFGKNIDHQGGDYGNATISRYPITEWDNSHFEQLGNEQRGVLQTLIDIDGWTVLVLNTHLAHRGQDSDERVLYAERTRDEILPRYQYDAVIFAGDFNDVPGSPVHEVMTSWMTDAWKVSGEGDGFTIPPDDPDRRIDYIFYDDGVRSLDAWVPVTMASDHLPVVVDFARNR